MNLFGWCFGPEEPKGDHGSCKAEIGTSSGINRCDCLCHGNDSREES